MAFNSIYTFFTHPISEPCTNLSDLGRATKRGIKKCPKCGTYNGTRGISCKNKLCDAVFSKDEKNLKLDAVRLVGTLRQIYSVRVQDRGAENRGFVQLSQERDPLCFVDTCHDSILKCHEIEPQNSICVHIAAALKSRNLATGLDFKRSILNSLKIPNEINKKLCSFVTENEDVLVQQVSRSVMAIKCQVSPKHPLGYLHFTFEAKGKEIFDKFHCGCSDKISDTKCLHYYACICALTSTKTPHEFAHFIQAELKNSPSSRNKKIKIQKKKKVAIKEISWKFQDWLSYVTESINNTMLFENYANVNTLIFGIPMEFYEAFTKRIPEIYTVGDVHCHKYRIMNILHVKQIFDTPDAKLKISKRFIHDNQNGYVEYQGADNVSCQPSFIFFLNVGESTVDESDNINNPFLIEWMPQIGTTKVGHLKLQYKYGRKSTT